ncbi:hypothetical protein DV736_g3162, partial [Chaetothyriales sp. CBS 134916]
MADAPSVQRRSDSSHRSEALKRMATHGVFMESSNLLRKESKKLCSHFLKGSDRAVRSSIFTPAEFSKVLDRVRNLNEARIQRDITPWVVPSAEILFLRGELECDWIGEELHAEWVRCATLGSTRPKPDYVAGLLRRAFTTEELKKLDNHATPTQPFHFTPELCFPFLICEVKTGDKGLNEAARQNIHSASIAVRAIFALYKNAFGDSQPHRIDELSGQLLVLTVSHDNDRVELCGHFAITDTNLPEQLKFYRYPITLFSLAADDGADRNKAYNFVREVYQQFAPDHRKRIKDAVKHLPPPPERTGLSFAASDLSLDQANSQEGSQDTSSQADSAFKKPGEPLSSLQKREIRKLREQTDKLLQQLEKQRQDSKEQLEKQRQDSREQMEQQRLQMEQQLQQQQEIISLLKGTKQQVVVSGAVAGLVSRFVIAPLDVVKIRLQLQPHSLSDPLSCDGIKGPTYKGVFASMRTIVRQEGLRSLWKGNVPAELMYICYGGIQFVGYRSITQVQEQARRHIDVNLPFRIPGSADSFVAGAGAGAIATTVTYPMDLLRTRFAAQGTERIYSGLVAACRDIVRDEGMRGYFRGLSAAVGSIVPYMGLFFSSYEIFHEAIGGATLPFGSGDAVAGVMASIVAKSATFPLDLIRKRLQIQGPTRQRYIHTNIPVYKGVWRGLFAIWRKEGVRGWYRGLTVSLVKAAPASAVTMYVYERTLHALMATDRTDEMWEMYTGYDDD